MRWDAAAHVFVSDLEALDLDDDDRHHLSRVLRLQSGEAVTASDGAGKWRSCTWTANGLQPESAIEQDPSPEPPIAVGFAIPKGDRPEWIVQKLTEVGVDRVIPLLTSRSVVRWAGDKATRNVDRLRRVAREAAMQSRRAWLPVVEEVTTLSDLIARAPNDVALAHPGGRQPTLTHTVVLIGPEGGWSPYEVESRALVGLGTNVLRTETAAITVGFLMCALRTGIVSTTS